MKKNYIFAAIGICCLLLFLGREAIRNNRSSQKENLFSRQTSDPKGSEKKSLHHPVQSIGALADLFRNADSYESLTELLKRYYLLDEELALAAWAEFDSPLFDEREESLSLFLCEIVGLKHPSLEAIKTLELLKEAKPLHFLNTATYILQDFSGDEEVADIVEFLNSGDHRELSKQAAIFIGMNGGTNNPKEYVAEIANIKDSELAGTVLEGVLSTWLDDDPDAVAAYLNSVEQTPVIETSLATIAESTSIVDPEIAMTWAESIDDESLRNQTVNFVAERWVSDKNEDVQDQYQTWKSSVKDPDLKIHLSRLEENAKSKTQGE